jgi:hypothetical protein
MGKEHRRGMSPPDKDWARDKVGEGAGTRGKATKSGYARSTHMKGDVGPTLKGHTHKYIGVKTDKAMAHTGYHTTGEKKEQGSGYKLPMEKHVPISGKAIAAGDHFESEIKEHFPTKHGVAGINDVAMGHKGSIVESESVSHKHGHASGKAEHHPGPKGEAHVFKPPLAQSHGYGHDGERRSGFLRLSGSKHAHQLGRRGK